MNAIELLKTPFYISQLNVVTPLTKINIYLRDVYIYAVNISTMLINIIFGMSLTILLIKDELFNILFSQTNQEILVFVIGVFCVFTFLLLNDVINNMNEQKKLIDTMESKLNYLSKMERMREEME